MSAHLATSLTSILTDSLSGFESFVSGRILIWLLIAAGAYLTVCTRGVQLRLLARPVALVAHSRHQRGSRPASRPSSSAWADAWAPATSPGLRWR